MICSRAVTLLRGLEKCALEIETEEIEELLAAGLAVEADPDDLGTVQWLHAVVREHAGVTLDHPTVGQVLASALKATEEDLARDWYRMKTSKAELRAREESRIAMRRALAHLADPHFMASARKLLEASRLMAAGARWVPCEKLGSELYGLTHKGWRVLRQLGVRLERYGNASLKAFLSAFEKTDAKMRAFAEEVSYLNQNIGYVKKNREQIVIGLAKAGASAPHAVGTYYAALQVSGSTAPDVAVTCTRNAKTFGGPAYAAVQLQRAQAALRQAGFPPTSIAMGAAKSLLAFQPPESGVPRFVEIFQRLERAVGRAEALVKYVARLMPATGTPEEVVRRVSAAATMLRQQVPPQVHAHRADVRATAAALASMVREDSALLPLVQRFRAIETELVRAGVSTPQHCEADALECVACPGTPLEVVDIVSTLAGQIAAGRRTGRADVAVAASFAKRFTL
jgi:hypothetical protein